MPIRNTACTTRQAGYFPRAFAQGSMRLDWLALPRLAEALASMHSENTPSAPKNSNLRDEVILRLPGKSVPVSSPTPVRPEAEGANYSKSRLN